jgi:tetratricopeptide (TPR) repeat protein
MIGMLYEAQGRPQDAEEWYQRALQIDSRAAAAANNLAWIWAEKGENLDSALELAQVALRELPAQPQVADTLAWVYYKKELYAMASPLLERAMAGDRANAVYPYHLGLVYLKRGETRKARQYLQQALDLDGKFRYADDARRVLKSLVY